jgi:hypothetical protein
MANHFIAIAAQSFWNELFENAAITLAASPSKQSSTYWQSMQFKYLKYLILAIIIGGA